MKKLKIINAIVWAVIAAVLDLLVIRYWGELGTPLKGVVLGCAFYTILCIGFGAFVHWHLKD